MLQFPLLVGLERRGGGYPEVVHVVLHPEQEEAEGEEGGHREAGADHSPGVGGDCVAPPVK